MRRPYQEVENILLRRSLAFVNARVILDGGEASAIRVGSRVLGVNTPLARGDVRVDLDGAFVLPGLINGHDHLELNHFGPVRDREQYANASEWIDEVDPKLETDPRLVRLRNVPRADALLIGALKNVLSGVTTVAHHNPAYAELSRVLPIRTLAHYGWAHSFYLHEMRDTERSSRRSRADAAVAAAYRETRRDVPFIVHLAEGTDARASGELRRLQAIGALGANTVVVHGVALSDADCVAITRARAGLVWCPASNLNLFGRTAPIRALLDRRGTAGRVALGTDSRLTGSDDLLTELRLADRLQLATRAELFRMVTANARSIFRLDHGGTLETDLPADLIVIPPAASDPIDALLQCQRRDVRLVMCGGRPIVGDRDFADVFRARGVKTSRVTVDEAPKLLDARLARRLARSAVKEPGLEVDEG